MSLIPTLTQIAEQTLIAYVISSVELIYNRYDIFHDLLQYFFNITSHLVSKITSTAMIRNPRRLDRKSVDLGTKPPLLHSFQL